jgi:hypothetical protein
MRPKRRCGPSWLEFLVSGARLVSSAGGSPIAHALTIKYSHLTRGRYERASTLLTSNCPSRMGQLARRFAAVSAMIDRAAASRSLS